MRPFTQADILARILRVLAQESRLRIIELLRGRSLCVNALARELGVTPAAVSQHLRVLKDAGVVIGDKQGYFVHYRLDEELLGKWGEQIRRFLSP
ncbi:ArsR/SmtB family transcription factor [Desulfocurvibacter africanus]|uniref:Regulatory protein ArsR n=1 Tax=Desulfocurvibacter africanus subsp. africanus str. Walvis Bay TaxID=690850 RepID=F3Z0D3_DESAF|nr:metalloregulator ArsR/SmtB family transcription factor [Desulfocurvibacter africanus]EGJ50943.1 regulatory protein ArsR [Desulfocurvibacter africanus subsp. africanus str. Walvis Bay]